MVKSTAAWGGFWIGLGIIVAALSIADRIDCYLDVPGSCERLAGYYTK